MLSYIRIIQSGQKIKRIGGFCDVPTDIMNINPFSTQKKIENLHKKTLELPLHYADFVSGFGLELFHSSLSAGNDDSVAVLAGHGISPVDIKIVEAPNGAGHMIADCFVRVSRFYYDADMTEL